MRRSVRAIWKGKRPVMERNARPRSGKWQAYSQKVPDKRLGGVLVPAGLEEIMLQLSGNPSQIEGAVGALHPFQVDRDHAEIASEKQIAGSGIAVHEHLVILPHTRLFAPAVAQPGQFVHIPVAGYLIRLQLSDDPVQIGAVLIEVDALPVGGTVVQRGEEVRQRG